MSDNLIKTSQIGLRMDEQVQKRRIAELYIETRRRAEEARNAGPAKADEMVFYLNRMMAVKDCMDILAIPTPP